MIETFTTQMQDVVGEGVKSISADVPNFAKDYEPSRIKSFEEANKPLDQFTIEDNGSYPSLEATFEKVLIDEEFYKGTNPEVLQVSNLDTNNELNGIDMENSNHGYRYIETRNQTLENDVHPVTGVPFEKKTIELPNGEIVEGVFPEFPVEYEIKLDESQYMDSDAKQFKVASEQLAQEVKENPELAKKFTPEQLEQIKIGETPDGYVWHHSEQPGVLQLVDKDLHDKTGHTGGRYLWGGGSNNR